MSMTQSAREIAAAAKAGYGHAAYGMLKVEGVADRIAALFG